MIRMDKRWDHGFIPDENQYLQERMQLQIELEQLMPTPNEELNRAVKLLKNFEGNWAELEGKEDLQRELLQMILKRVYVKEEDVVALTLHSDYHMILGHKMKEPTPIEVDSCSYTDGNDGFMGPRVYEAHNFLYPARLRGLDGLIFLIISNPDYT